MFFFFVYLDLIRFSESKIPTCKSIKTKQNRWCFHFRFISCLFRHLISSFIRLIYIRLSDFLRIDLSNEKNLPIKINEKSTKSSNLQCVKKKKKFLRNWSITSFSNVAKFFDLWFGCLFLSFWILQIYFHLNLKNDFFCG